MRTPSQRGGTPPGAQFGIVLQLPGLPHDKGREGYETERRNLVDPLHGPSALLLNLFHFCPFRRICRYRIEKIVALPFFAVLRLMRKKILQRRGIAMIIETIRKKIECVKLF